MGNLVLTRRQGERLFIDTKDGRIVLEVVKITSGVKLAVRAPHTVIVLREELETTKANDHVAHSHDLR